MKKNLFGTDGIRGVFGKEPLTTQSLIQTGRAIAQWAQKKYRHTPTILIAHDTRISCSLAKASLKAGLLEYPVQIHDGGVLPSPAVLQLINNNPLFDCGIIISASHNPHHDNGIKLIDSTGKLSEADELTLSSLIRASSSHDDYSQLGTEIWYTTAADEYINQVIAAFKPNFLQAKTIVLDCAHGATYHVAARIFRALGARVITQADKPNGLNINKQCGSLHPHILQKAVIEHKADAGFAFDGDGDRVIAVNRYGQLKNGDDLLALLAFHPKYIQEKTIVGTIMSNHGFELFLHSIDKELYRTPVGDKYVVAQMKQTNALLGGEQSGHIIVRDYLATGDGIFTALRTLEAMQHTNNWDMHTFTKYPQILINVPVSKKEDLSQEPFQEIIAASETKLNSGRLIIRYSGTEPVLRIMIEDDDCDHAQSIGTLLSRQLQEQLS